MMFRMNGWRSRSSRSGRSVSLIGEGSVLEGTFRSEADVRIEGEFQGVLQAAGEVAVGAKGIVRSTDLRARDVVIAGRMDGRVEAEGTVRITPTGRLVGTVRAATLIIEPGAVFQGQSEMGQTPQEDASLVIAVL
ncbi:polymer-forming cytoskeletal protein [Paenibacillus elgii]|nr:polymer-forming cytoskeletal protein [Paenibacillus elgii]